MLLKEPRFWYRQWHPLSVALAPLGWLYDAGVRLRFALATPARVRLPIICIGNFTLGGAGKTPLAIEVARLLRERGLRPVFLSRGYGGSSRGPHLVDPERDPASLVGDEPLLLARHAPVVVSADRVAGARFIERLDADAVVMDDGFQNPTLAKTLSLVVVDARRGIGNGRTFPAGPLRASLPFQLPRADILVVDGTTGERAPDVALLLARFRGQIVRTRIEPEDDVAWLAGTRVVAVAGIAHPAKFRATLEKLGAEVVAARDYPDHHMFSDEDARFLLEDAEKRGLTLVMTEKDWVRLPERGARGDLKRAAKVLRIRLAIEDREALRRRLLQVVESRR